MIIKFLGMNISLKDPKRLALFYRDVSGLPMLNESPDYDGVTFGNSNKEPVLWIWDESKRGRANEGAVCRVFHCDDHDKTYEELKQKGVDLDSPKTAVWGGKRALCEGSGRKYRFDSVGFTKSLMGYI
ncbi:MAG: VOC family protein [Clostridia bacterium]|jgi:predicted enzyme related to lactoylglutathione lyase|nr:VOC family protein [Clostridiaceae bacterium]